MNPYQAPKSQDDRPSFMKGDRYAVQCPHCKHEFDSIATTSFLGFKRFVCFQCNEKFNYPLFRGYRITYWILLLVALIYFAISPSTGQPSFFVFAMSFAVIADVYLLWRRK